MANWRGAAETAEPRPTCTEKDRLRWEAKLNQWGADCESKLKRVGALVKKQKAAAVAQAAKR